MTLFDPLFWRSIAWMLVRTALAASLPFWARLATDPVGTLPLAGSTILLALVLAIAAALKGIPTGGAWWEQLLSRGLRQFGQFFLAAAGSAALLSDVEWSTIIAQALASAASTVVIASLTMLPSSTVAVVVPGQVVTNDESLFADPTDAELAQAAQTAPGDEGTEGLR